MVIDILILIAIAWAAYKGFTKGLIVQAATLAALVLGIYGATQFSWYTARLIQQHFQLQSEFLPFLAFIITFIVIVILVHLLAKLLEKLLQAIALGIVNRISGMVFSILKMSLILSVLFLLLNTVNSYKPFLPGKELAQSRLYYPISRLVPSVFPMLHFNGEGYPQYHYPRSTTPNELNTQIIEYPLSDNSYKLNPFSGQTDFFS